MTLRISDALRKKLPANERGNLEQKLLDKAGGRCFLCDQSLDLDKEELVADHDLADDKGGETKLENLNVAHVDCNGFKRNHATTSVRPFLKLKEGLRRSGNERPTYRHAADVLELNPRAVTIKRMNGQLELTSKSGSKVAVPIYSDRRGATAYEFAFVPLGPESIFNDEDCQPRPIRLTHLWSIYTDLLSNPLHEPPACRAVPESQGSDRFRLLMFDGQHKTLASWLAGRETVTVKIYLDFSRDQAIQLVNSVQAKIKKLPLSPFELAAKMSEEWRDRWESYVKEATATGTPVTEAGFLRWNGENRTRAKAALQEALCQNIIDSADLNFRKLIAKPGEKKPGDTEPRVQENAFRKKVLPKLLHMEALVEEQDEREALRNRETQNVVKLLNLLQQHGFEELSVEKYHERARRLKYQSALVHVSGLLRSLVGNVLSIESPRELIEKSPTLEQWVLIEKGVRRLLEHPVWWTPFTTSRKMKRIQDSLKENQDAKKVFDAVGLKLGYVNGSDAYEPDLLHD